MASEGGPQVNAERPATDSSDPLPIFKPLRSDAPGPDVLLVVIPGAFTAPEAYLPLAEAVHAGSGDVRLWVGMLRFERNIPTSEAIVPLYKQLLGRVRAEGYRGGDLFHNYTYFIGHSWGGWVARVPARQLARGLVQLACSFAPDVPDDIAEYPLPVLTLGGTLDGQIPAVDLARNGRQVAAREPLLGEKNTLFAKPVAVIVGANHASFSHGVPNTERGDLPAELPLEEARAAAARLVNAFLAIQTNGSGGGAARAGEHAAALRSAVRETQELYGFFWDAVEEERAGCEGYQAKLLEDAGVQLPPAARTALLWHEFYDNLVAFKPWVDAEQGKVFAGAHQKKDRYGVTQELCLKMKSPEAVARAFGLGERAGNGRAEAAPGGGALAAAVEDFDVADPAKVGAIVEAQRAAPGSNTFGAEANRAAFDAALGRLPPYFRTRFERLQLSVRFPDDVRANTSSDWIKSEITFTFSEDGRHVDVVSPILIVPDDPALGRFGGHHYVKIWTVVSAMHWIMYDAFQKGTRISLVNTLAQKGQGSTA